GDAERVLASDRDERVEVVAERAQRALDASLQRVRVGAARGDDRAAAGQDAGDLAPSERPQAVLDETPPALDDADHLVVAVERTARDRADDGVQAGAVAAAGEHSDPHRSDDSWLSAPAARPHAVASAARAGPGRAGRRLPRRPATRPASAAGRRASPTRRRPCARGAARRRRPRARRARAGSSRAGNHRRTGSGRWRASGSAPGAATTSVPPPAAPGLLLRLEAERL